MEELRKGSHGFVVAGKTNALWASGESDVDLMDKELKLYEEEHKNDGPFMFMHCWDI